MSAPEPWCPVREEPCTICQMGVTGPSDCGLLYLLLDDPEWRTEYNRRRQVRKSPHPTDENEKD